MGYPSLLKENEQGFVLARFVSAMSFFSCPLWSVFVKRFAFGNLLGRLSSLSSP